MLHPILSVRGNQLTPGWVVSEVGERILASQQELFAGCCSHLAKSMSPRAGEEKTLDVLV